MANTDLGNGNLRPETFGKTSQELPLRIAGPPLRPVLGEASYGNVVLSCCERNHVGLRGLPGGAEGDYREARALQKAVSKATRGIAQPAMLIISTVAIASWLTLNLALPRLGRAALDPFPFPLLSAAVSTVGFYLAAMILFSQRHDGEMATRREQMTLELAILSEQKSAKIIALLEEFRRNDPNQGNDPDEVAEALAKPADAQVVLDAIRAAEKAEEATAKG